MQTNQRLNPFPWYRSMRETAPVYFDKQQYMWHVFRYDDVQRVLSDYASFSSARGRGGDQPLSASMISMDPPRHRQLRALTTQAFTPRAVDALAPRIQGIVNDLIEQVMARGQMDMIEDFSYPLPVIVIAELLGIPPADRARFKAWSDAIVSTSNTMGAGGMTNWQAQREMVAYFTDIIAQRRREPGADLISGLLAAQIEGQHLTTQELLGFCVLLLVAGNETTTTLLGNAMLCFTEQPEAWQRLRAEPALLPSAIEEVLRYLSPVQSMFRVAAKEVELGGQHIPEYARVLAWIGSANRDEAQFPNADEFDITRSPNRHIAFGYGIHYCLGAPLARLESRIALSAMLERFTTVRRAPDAELEPLESTIVYGVHSLPMTFEPG
jgi:cytochrome P450